MYCGISEYIYIYIFFFFFFFFFELLSWADLSVLFSTGLPVDPAITLCSISVIICLLMGNDGMISMRYFSNMK